MTGQMYANRSHYLGTFVLVCSVTCACTFMFSTVKHIDVGHKPKRTCVQPRIFVGVFTAAGSASQYVERRAALRATWFPNTTEALARLECRYGMTMRFVVGIQASVHGTQHDNSWHEEKTAHGDFLEVNVVDDYKNLTEKTWQFFHALSALHDEYAYVVKVDDDMYVSPNHLVMAVNQWGDMKVDYIGCMANPGPIYRQEGECRRKPMCEFERVHAEIDSPAPVSNQTGHKWYEPLHDHLASQFHMYACGSMYVLSRSAIMRVFHEQPRFHRLFANEDQSTGMWMLAHEVTFFDDRRLCASSCNSSHAFVGVNSGYPCNGLPDPLVELPALHTSAACHAKPPGRLPFINSNFKRFNEMMESYRARNLENA